ncbi:MAG: hypothetical protein WBP18_01770, partial [Paracoccaceae bacterium]
PEAVLAQPLMANLAALAKGGPRKAPIWPRSGLTAPRRSAALIRPPLADPPQPRHPSTLSRFILAKISRG